MNIARRFSHFTNFKLVYHSHYDRIPVTNNFFIRTSHTDVFRNLILSDGRRINSKRRVNFLSSCYSRMDVSCDDVFQKHVSCTGFHTSRVSFHGEYEWQDPKSEEEIVKVQVEDKDGNTFNIKGKIGDNLLYLAKRFDVGMEGACEASLACTTCHIYVSDDYLDLLPESTETEEDLLDQAPFLRQNSRLGCQIILNKQLDGIKLMLPAATKNFYVDGHKPTPH